MISILKRLTCFPMQSHLKIMMRRMFCTSAQLFLLQIAWWKLASNLSVPISPKARHRRHEFRILATHWHDWGYKRVREDRMIKNNANCILGHMLITADCLDQAIPLSSLGEIRANINWQQVNDSLWVSSLVDNLEWILLLIRQKIITYTVMFIRHCDSSWQSTTSP